MASLSPISSIVWSSYIEPTILHDGSRMEGDFHRGTGSGKRIFDNGHIWQGNFVDWLLNGEGEHIFPDGEK